MKTLKKWGSLFAILAVVLVLGIMFSSVLLSNPVKNIVLEPFYGVSEELEAKMEQIALKDTRISELMQENEDTISIGDYTFQEKDYSLAVGVRLKEGVTLEEYKDWKKVNNDLDIIDKYVGVLNVGYNDRYHIVFDIQTNEVKEIKQEIGYRDIPELTGEEKQLAVDIALADTNLQHILKDKEFEFGLDGEIGVWHEGDTKLGVVFEIVFDEPNAMDCMLPRYNQEPFHIDAEVESLMIKVHLEEQRIASIFALIPAPETILFKETNDEEKS